MIRPDVTPQDPIDEQPAIGLIGMGGMGTMYAKSLASAGWKKWARSTFSPCLPPTYGVVYTILESTYVTNLASTSR